jgi:hypothetical protein
LRSSLLQDIAAAVLVVHARFAEGILDFSATHDAFFKACSPKNRVEGAEDRMFDATDPEAECARTTSTATAMTAKKTASTIARRLSPRDRLDLLL